MTRKRFSEEDILGILRQIELDLPFVVNPCFTILTNWNHRFYSRSRIYVKPIIATGLHTKVMRPVNRFKARQGRLLREVDEIANSG